MICEEQPELCWLIVKSILTGSWAGLSAWYDPWGIFTPIFEGLPDYIKTERVGQHLTQSDNKAVSALGAAFFRLASRDDVILSRVSDLQRWFWPLTRELAYAMDVSREGWQPVGQAILHADTHSVPAGWPRAQDRVGYPGSHPFGEERRDVTGGTRAILDQEYADYVARFTPGVKPSDPPRVAPSGHWNDPWVWILAQVLKVGPWAPLGSCDLTSCARTWVALEKLMAAEAAEAACVLKLGADFLAGAWAKMLGDLVVCWPIINAAGAAQHAAGIALAKCLEDLIHCLVGREDPPVPIHIPYHIPSEIVAMYAADTHSVPDPRPASMPHPIPAGIPLPTAAIAAIPCAACSETSSESEYLTEEEF